MVSEYPAQHIGYAGLGAEGLSPADAAEALALRLRQWSEAHADCRILQLSVTAAQAGGTEARAGVMALLAYVETGLTSADAAEAVVAAIEEIREAQSAEVEPVRHDDGGIS